VEQNIIGKKYLLWNKYFVKQKSIGRKRFRIKAYWNKCIMEQKVKG
jgi:hypothetical protein